MRSETRAILRREQQLIVVDLSGQVTTFSEDEIVAAYREASETGVDHILLSFANVDYINSAGIAVIIGILTEARRNDQTILVTGLTPHYTKIFNLMGLAQYVPIFATENDAKRSLSRIDNAELN